MDFILNQHPIAFGALLASAAFCFRDWYWGTGFYEHRRHCLICGCAPCICNKGN